MQKTPLHDEHEKLGATIVDFGGWAMPVQYTNVIEEHRTTRENAGLFDICHMCEFMLTGSQAYDLTQWVTSRNLKDQVDGQVKLTTFTNERGGIVDDATVYRFADAKYMIVANASTREKDFAWLQKAKEDKGLSDVVLEDISDITGKLDIQGPKSQEILQQITADDLNKIAFYYFFETTVDGLDAIVSRTGYTGEDGFEVYIPWDKTVQVWNKLLSVGDPHGMKPIGLGARDTLRLEAALNLYGHEINEDITPLESRYGWLANLEEDFLGCDVLRRQKTEGVQKKLVGFEMVDRGIAREHYDIYKDGKKIGAVSSGTFSPTFNKSLGMAHLEVAYTKPDTEIEIEIRNKLAKAKVVKLPFYRKNY